MSRLSGRPKLLVTDRLRSSGAAMKVIGVVDRRVCGQLLNNRGLNNRGLNNRGPNNRAENSHQPFRRREVAMAKFKDGKTVQKFAAARASNHSHFNHDRHLNRRDICNRNRAAARADWRRLAA